MSILCPCCSAKPNDRLLIAVSKLREMGYDHDQYPINSGMRCHSHNRAVGGSLRSWHKKGLAVDIHVPSAILRQQRKAVFSELMGDAIYVGFRGIGIYRNFIHLDLRPSLVVFRNHYK